MTRKDVVAKLLHGAGSRAPTRAGAFAPANIALAKYWGKRDDELHLPLTDSLSVSLGQLGTQTTVEPAEQDTCVLNGDTVDPACTFGTRLGEFLELLRPSPDFGFHIETVNSVPTAAGVASSASGYAALVLALDRCFGWELPARKLSILARLGSGSACRSVYAGFVHWHAGRGEDGMDSFAEPLGDAWPALRVGLVTVSDAPKTMSSRLAMAHCRDRSPYFPAWIERQPDDLAAIREAIATMDIDRLGTLAEANALAMHATMLAATPAVLYWQPETVAILHRLRELRGHGVGVYATIDAGPNVKLLFTAADAAAVTAAFPGIEVVVPFATEETA